MEYTLEGTFLEVDRAKVADKVKEVVSFLSKRFPNDIQMFSTPNVAGDEMEFIYNKFGVYVLYCRYWDYIEVLGLTAEEFQNVMELYQNSEREIPCEDDEDDDDDTWDFSDYPYDPWDE